MTNVAHSSLTGGDLHEPKGAAAAASGTVYVANGSGSGVWSSLSALTGVTGQIASYATVVVPSGWLECDGSTPTRAGQSALWSVLSTSLSGVHTNGSPVVTGISSTANLKPGYYVGGNGMPAGTQILTVDSGTQVTLTMNATASATSTLDFAPWGVGDGSTTFTLPFLNDTGRYLRSRSSASVLGTYQADSVGPHSHTASGTTDSQGNHSHTINISDPGHPHNFVAAFTTGLGGTITSGGSYAQNGGSATSSATTGITASSVSTGAHTHNLTITVANNTGTETRPQSVVVLYCIKT